MNAHEQWTSFFKHEYDNEAMPPFTALALLKPTGGPQEDGDSSGQGGTDWFGTKWVFDEGANCPVPDCDADFVLDDIDDWKEKVIFPDLDALDWEANARADGADKVDHENQFSSFYFRQGAFERLHSLMGFEEALVSIAASPDSVMEFVEAWTDWRLHELDLVAQYYRPDSLLFHDDMGMQNGMFMASDVWRKIFKPQLKRIVDRAHELGIYFMYHSCGNIEDIVSELPEIGIDAWQGQEINDVLKLKEQTKGQLEYVMMPDYQALCSKETEPSDEEIFAFAKAGISRNIKGGHYVAIMQPFGDCISLTLTKAVVGICMQYMGDPVKAV